MKFIKHNSHFIFQQIPKFFNKNKIKSIQSPTLIPITFLTTHFISSTDNGLISLVLSSIESILN